MANRLHTSKVGKWTRILGGLLAIFSGLFLIYSLRRITSRKSEKHRLLMTTMHSSEAPKTLAVVRRTTAPKSFYQQFGLADLKILKQLSAPRPRFNFSMTPWRVLPENPQIMGSKAVRWSMIVVIKSDYRRGDQREIIRKTWGAVAYLNGARFVLIFVIATPDDSAEQMKLSKENGVHGDLLQVNKKEVYEDIGLKALAGMQWVKDNFPQDWIYSSADDDILPDLKKLSETIDNLVEQKKAKNVNETLSSAIQKLPITCSFVYRETSHPLRDGKWKVDKKMYPYKDWPPACLGGFYSMPVNLSNDILEISRHIPYFHLDDVWFTAFLRLKLCDASPYLSAADKADKYCNLATIKNAGNFEHLPKATREEFAAKWQERESAIRTSGIDVIIMT